MARAIGQDTADQGRLTPATVVDRALALADAEGLQAVTIRRLAHDLGVTPMALYWHFRNKEQLLDGLVDRIVAEIDLRVVDAAAPWLEQLRTLLEAILRVLRAHPSAATLLSSTRSTQSERALRVQELILDLLRRAGFSPQAATDISRHALRTAYTLVTGEPGLSSRRSPQEVADFERRTRIFLETLPPDRYPRLVEAAIPLSTCDPDAYYAFGLDLLLAGIQAMAASRQPPPRSP
jgi:TetR/AcrR family transcriptional regulator, tetracycline repressor protein